MRNFGPFSRLRAKRTNSCTNNRAQSFLRRNMRQQCLTRLCLTCRQRQ
jgi:hypothetical protein